MTNKTTKQQNNKTTKQQAGTDVQTTSPEVALLQEQESTFNVLKHHLNGLKDSNKSIIIQAVLMYRLGYNKETLFNRVKEEYKGTDNWTAIRVNATRNFTSAEGLLKLAKKNGVDMTTWTDSQVVDSFMKEQACTINGLYKEGQKSNDNGTDVQNGGAVVGAVMTDLNRFEGMVLKAIEKWQDKVNKKDMAESLMAYAETLKKQAEKKEEKKEEKAA